MASARLIRQASYRHHSQEELEPLLDEEHGQDEEPEYDEAPPRAPYQFSDLPVYENIWRIRRTIIKSIADPYTLEQLRAPRLNTSVVRPLMKELYELHDVSIVFCLLVNRVQFLRDQSYQAHYLSVSTARALLCELLALRILRQFDDDSSGRNGLLLLSNILISGFEAFQNCPSELSWNTSRKLRWPMQKRDGYEHQHTALEIAIISDSKLFLSSPACQKVVDAIYVGRIIYTPTTFIDILPDHYKIRAVALYNPKRGSLLNQYRLNVPRTRNVIEITHFIILLVLFVCVMETRNSRSFATMEVIFCVYTYGWILDQLASILEHGWRVYSENLWAFLDVMFAAIFLVYFALRVHGVTTGTVLTSKPALDILAMGAPFLIPRLAFNVFSENLLFVSLREMMSKFVLLTFLAIWTFAGFFLSMLWLSEGQHSPHTIGKWLIWIWFGLDGTGIQRSTEFHWLLGPVLMITFAVLGNTLFLTILVSTLSNTFSSITKYSVAEIQFRRAVLTFEGVKSDALFAYMPPFNILALFIMLPLKTVLSPRWFHKINVTIVRILNAPWLLLINAFERRTLWKPRGSKAIGASHTNAGQLNSSLGSFVRFRTHGDIQAVFEFEPPRPSLNPRASQQGFRRVPSNTAESPSKNGHDRLSPNPRPRGESLSKVQQSLARRRESVWEPEGLEMHVARMLQEHDDVSRLEHGNGHDDEINDRLQALEASNRRIESMLSKLCEDMAGKEEAEREGEGDGGT
ncbi:MAG: hypothetical protein M1828_001660 [Chrysothrix sp. TS-e1954]|nr:MAG: hypothetical protein M1828_001660 [Chrysothrix sp. TS-e1954]